MTTWRRSRNRTIILVSAALIVLVVIVLSLPLLLTLLVAPRLLRDISKSNQKVCVAHLASIGQQLSLYMADHELSSLPSNITLNVLTTGRAPYLRPSDLIDPWGGQCHFSNLRPSFNADLWQILRGLDRINPLGFTVNTLFYAILMRWAVVTLLTIRTRTRQNAISVRRAATPSASAPCARNAASR